MALFAALAYAVTQSGRGGGNISKETALLDASKIVQYAGAVGQAVIRMRLAAGCSDTQISFENASVGGYTNAGAPADKSCHVFEANGGAIPWQKAPAGSNDGQNWMFHRAIMVHTRDGSNSTLDVANTDLVMLLPGLTQSVCEAINNGLGITGVPVDEGFISSSEILKFAGIYAFNFSGNVTGLSTASQPSPCIAAPGTGLCGKLSGCFKEGAGGERYIFYNVLISR